jgi:hypothetical protein
MFAPRYSYALWSRTRARLGGAMPSDLLGPPGRCSGCWPHDSMVRSPAAPSPILFSDFRFGATMELGRSGRSMMMMMMTSASASGGDGGVAGRAQRGTGSSTTDRKICSTDRGGACGDGRGGGELGGQLRQPACNDWPWWSIRLRSFFGGVGVFFVCNAATERRHRWASLRLVRLFALPGTFRSPPRCSSASGFPRSQ